MTRRFYTRKIAALVGVLSFAAGLGWTAKDPPKPLPVKLTAKIVNRFNWDTKKDNEYEDTSRTTLDLNAQVKYIPNPVVQVVAGEWMVDGKIRPYNIYLNLASEHINFRLGNQIVRWGKADEISPLDVVNPEDLSLGLNRTRAERKIPIPMANVEFLSDALSLQGIFIPFAQKSIFHYEGDDWAYFGHLDKVYGPLGVTEEDTPQTLKDAGYGGRLSFTLLRCDMAFSYLNHRRDIPTLVPFAIPAPVVPGQEGTLEDLVKFSKYGVPAYGIPPQPIRFRYLREERYGFELETTAGSLGFRGDASYVSSESFITASLQEQRRPVITAVGGIDYNGSGGSYINVSYSESRVQNFDASLAPNKKCVSSLSSQFSLELFSGNIKLGYLGFSNLTDKSYYQNPKININFIPNIGIETGVEIYSGAPSTQIGFFDPNDQVYLSLSYFF